MTTKTNAKRDLLDLMNSAYPDGFMAQYYDGNGDLIPLSDEEGHLADGLARYLVAEATGLYEDKKTVAANKRLVINALTNTLADLEAVIRSLED